MADGRSVFGGLASLPLSGTAAVLLLLATIAMAQQGSTPGPPPPNRSTPVEANELRETWNDRASQGPPVGATPEFDGWSMGAAMPLPRSEHSVAEFSGRIWVVGGYPPGRLPSNLVQVYDPATSRWSLGPTLPQPIHHTHVAAVGGKLYMIGGELEGASTGKPEVYIAETWVHDPAAGGWVQRAPMPTPRSGGGKAVIDGKIYVAGGRPPGGSAFEVYDPTTDKWEKLPDLPTQRNHLAMVALNGKIIVAGGRTGPGAMAERVSVVEIYDPLPAAGPRAHRFRRPAAASPARSMPAACSCSAARASGPTCWA